MRSPSGCGETNAVLPAHQRDRPIESARAVRVDSDPRLELFAATMGELALADRLEHKKPITGVLSSKVVPMWKKRSTAERTLEESLEQAKRAAHTGSYLATLISA